MSKRHLVLVTLFLCIFVATASAQTVTAGTGGDFSTLAAAITSFRTGGSNASNADPNVINCLDATYDEALPIIDVQLTINGKSPKSTVLLQQSSDGDGDDGLPIDIAADTTVEFNDLIFLPSATSTPGDDLIDVVDGLSNSVLNFNDCIISANYSGAPANSDGFTAPSGTATARVADNGLNIVTASDGLTINISGTIIVDAAGPTSAGTADNILITGDGAKNTNITDGSIISYATRANIQGNGGILNITGTHDSPIYVIKSLGIAGDAVSDDGVGIGLWLERAASANITYCIIADNEMHGMSIQPEEKTVTLNHVIIANNGGYGLSTLNAGSSPFETQITAENVTVSGNGGEFVTPTTNDQVFLRSDLTYTPSFTGCIFADGDNGVNIGTNSTANTSYCGLVLAGANALGAKKTGDGTLNESNVITDDPQFMETSNFQSDLYFDVAAAPYETAYNGNPLVGGADFYAPATPTPTPMGFSHVTQDWMLYE